MSVITPSCTILPSSVFGFHVFSGAGTDSICFATFRSSAPGNSSSAIFFTFNYFYLDSLIISLSFALLAQILNSCFPAPHCFLNIAQTALYWGYLFSVSLHNPGYVLLGSFYRQGIDLFRCAEQPRLHQGLLSGTRNIFPYVKEI